MTNTKAMTEELLPCPFCGHVGISLGEGSTFRWRTVSCDECSAQTGEIRIQTIGDGTNEEWEANARTAAIREWNTRAALSAPMTTDNAKLIEALVSIFEHTKTCEVDNFNSLSGRLTQIAVEAGAAIRAHEALSDYHAQSKEPQ